MWTSENRGRYDRSGLRYPSDLTNEEWALVEPLIPPARRGEWRAAKRKDRAYIKSRGAELMVRKRAADIFDIPFAWLTTPDYSLTQAKARLGDILKYYYDSNRETPVHLIMEECCKTLGIAPDEPLSPEKAAELRMLVAYRLGHYNLGLPYVEAITPERLAEILYK